MPHKELGPTNLIKAQLIADLIKSDIYHNLKNKNKFPINKSPFLYFAQGKWYSSHYIGVTSTRQPNQEQNLWASLMCSLSDDRKRSLLFDTSGCWPTPNGCVLENQIQYHCPSSIFTNLLPTPTPLHPSSLQLLLLNKRRFTIAGWRFVNCLI